MNMTRRAACWLTSAVLAFSGAAIAQDKPAGYPVRPIRSSSSRSARAATRSRAQRQMLTQSGARMPCRNSRPGGRARSRRMVARSAHDGTPAQHRGPLMLRARQAVHSTYQGVRPIVPTSDKPTSCCEPEHAVQIDQELLRIRPPAVTYRAHQAGNR